MTTPTTTRTAPRIPSQAPPCALVEATEYVDCEQCDLGVPEGGAERTWCGLTLCLACMDVHGSSFAACRAPECTD